LAERDGRRRELTELRESLLLGPAELRAAHAQVLGTTLWAPVAAKSALDDVDVEQVNLTVDELRWLGWAPGTVSTPPTGGIDAPASGSVDTLSGIKLARRRGFVEDLRDKGGALWIHGLRKGLRVPGWNWTDNPHTLCGRPGYFSKLKGKVVDCAGPLFAATGLSHAAFVELFSDG
jgi:hypothetical protein